MIKDILFEQSIGHKSEELEVARGAHRLGHQTSRSPRTCFLIDRMWSWFQAVFYKDWRTWAVILVLAWSVFIFAIFLVKPLWLLRWNEALKDQLSVKIKPADIELSLGIPVGYVSLIRVFACSRRVLNAWVKAHIEKCRANFGELPTVKDRKVHVLSPVKVDGQLVAEFSAATLQATSTGRATSAVGSSSAREEPARLAWPARWLGGPWPRTRPIASPPTSCFRSSSRTSWTTRPPRAGLPRFTEAIRGSFRPSSARQSRFPRSCSSTSCGDGGSSSSSITSRR